MGVGTAGRRRRSIVASVAGAMVAMVLTGGGLVAASAPAQAVAASTGSTSPRTIPGTASQVGACPTTTEVSMPGCGPVGPLASDGGPFLTDALGRTVILHGVDAVYKRAPYALTVEPGRANSFTAADARAIAGLGFDVVRLGILWEGIEPGTADPNDPAICTTGRPGHAHQWDQQVADAYLAKVRAVVDLLGRYGIFSLVDMHQDVYDQVFAGEGAPPWAVCTDGLPATNTPDWTSNYGEPAVGVAFHHFWTNDVVGDLQGNFDRAWANVARTFAGNRYVVGFDPFNEPFATADLTVAGGAAFDAELECFYTGTAHPGRLWLSPVPLTCPPDDPAQGVIATIRSIDPTTPVFYEPDVIDDFGAVDWIGPMPFAHLVLNFHDYCLPGSVSQQVADLPVPCGPEEALTIHQQASARQVAADPANPGGPAWFMSEFGGEPAGADLARMVALADQHLLGWAYWAWESYDDPTGNPDEGLARPGPTGTPVVDPARAAILSEPYATAVAGTPTAMSFDPTTDVFTLTYRADDHVHAPTVVFVPVARHFADGYCPTVTGATVTSRPEARHLTLADRAGATTVHLVVRSGACR
jgi:endoglycosylceramidase